MDYGGPWALPQGNCGMVASHPLILGPIMVDHGGLWWIMVDYGPCGLWWIMVGYDGLWWILMGYCGLWWLMVDYYGVWPLIQASSGPKP